MLKKKQRIVWFLGFSRVFVLIPHIYTVPSQSGQYNQQSRTNNFSLFISVTRFFFALALSLASFCRFANTPLSVFVCTINSQSQIVKFSRRRKKNICLIFVPCFVWKLKSTAQPTIKKSKCPEWMAIYCFIIFLPSFLPIGQPRLDLFIHSLRYAFLHFVCCCGFFLRFVFVLCFFLSCFFLDSVNSVIVFAVIYLLSVLRIDCGFSVPLCARWAVLCCCCGSCCLFTFYLGAGRRVRN